MYFRDRAAVLFSLLTMAIVIALMVIFLGDMNVNSVTNILTEFGTEPLGTNYEEQASRLMLMWTIAGIMAVNAVNVSLAVTGISVSDNAQHKTASFLTSPVSRTTLSLGYIGAAFICSVLMCLVTLAAAECFAVFAWGVPALSLSAHLKIIGITAVNAFCYSSILYLISIFIRSNSAWSGFGTVIGTLVGFLGAIYVPMGGLPQYVQSGLKFTPVIYSSSLYRQVFTEELISNTFKAVPDAVIEEYMEQMGITLSAGGDTISAFLQIAILIFCGIIALSAAALIMKHRSVKDR
jgi:multidrug/hemolysin transport system permease protein